MKPIFFLIAICLPGLAFAGDCPKGANVKLTDATAATSGTAQTAAPAQSSGSNKGVKNHFPH